MEDVYANLLSAYGPFAVFLLLMLTGVGVPLGEDLVIIPAGILVGTGALEPWLTAVSVYAGVLISDCMWYAICSQYGTRLLHMRWFKRTIHPRRMLEVKHHIEERGAWVVFMARFIPGSRTPAITSAGVLHLPFWKFVVATATGCLFTVPLQLGLGFLIARGVGDLRTADLVQAIVGVLVFLLAILLGLAWWRKFRAQRQRRPRAKAAWLRRFRPRGFKGRHQP
ncbi:MAG: DedA family protein [Planctomycetota bacterium]|jgi:membrane protein DedA with SNARE-associated domain